MSVRVRVGGSWLVPDICVLLHVFGAGAVRYAATIWMGRSNTPPFESFSLATAFLVCTCVVCVMVDVSCYGGNANRGWVYILPTIWSTHVDNDSLVYHC